MSAKRSLTPAQIQYLRIGPKVNNLATASKKLQECLNKFEEDGTDSTTTLANIPKLTYGDFQNTVSNFGVLLHRNFVGTTTLHQSQKYGKVAFLIDPYMQTQSDKPKEEKKGGHHNTNVDARIAVKAIYDYKGHKMLITLKSFTIQSLHSHKIIETLPIAYVKLLTTHVSSGKLVKTLEAAMKQEGSTVVIDYERIEGKVNHFQNNDVKYQDGPYVFERSSQQFAVHVPCLEIYNSQSNYRANIAVQNKDILEILESDFDNVQAIVQKYIKFQEFQAFLQEEESPDKSEMD